MRESRDGVGGRLEEATLERFLEYAARMLKLAARLEKDKRPRRIVDQITGAGTSPGAHMFEAHEAVSAADFSNLVGGGAKELSESRFWLKLIVSMKWLGGRHIDNLLDETEQLLRITKSLRARTRRKRTT